MFSGDSSVAEDLENNNCSTVAITIAMNINNGAAKKIFKYFFLSQRERHSATATRNSSYPEKDILICIKPWLTVEEAIHISAFVTF